MCKSRILKTIKHVENPKRINNNKKPPETNKQLQPNYTILSQYIKVNCFLTYKQ